MSFVRDTVTVFEREMAPTWRNPFGLLFTMVQPLLFLYLFGPVLSGSTDLGGAPWEWFVPGILIMMCLSGPMMAGYTLLVELIGGSMERMLVTPLSRTAMLVGRTLKEFVVLLAQGGLLIGLAIPLGLDLHLPGVLTGLALLIVFGVGLGALSFVLAIVSAPGGELFYAVTQLTVFPLLLLSGVLLPVDAGPAWLQTAAALNPVTYIVEAERALFTGAFTTPAVLYGTLAATAVAALGLTLGTRAMRRGI
ncbi:ABC transporter permease [Acrocarpospora catenulata]|uniref:ABC transporter permease n=1 Tax=Acrocarpospora catenulata TaxID=2836182 RepID=UPI001BDABBA0|nr:ABC transporter permease [Acrocarpospora catenulata]